MKQVEIKVSINAEDANHLKALNLFLTSIAGNGLVPSPKPVETKKETTKQKVDEEKKEEPKKDSGITRDQLRTLTTAKAKINRDAVKAKLSELGASTVTTLGEDKFDEYNEFLKTIN